MLVDDEADILVALQDLFEDRYRVLAFSSPAAALAQLAADPDVSVIVSDQRMPGMTGDVFLAKARQLTDAGAILLTGYADLSAVTAALNAGGIVGYVPKPWEPDALRAMVAGACEQRELRRALRQEQALLRGLMDNVPYAVAFKDREGRYLQLNAQKAAALGLAASACAGRTAEQLGGPPPSETERSALTDGRAAQEVVETPAVVGSTWVQFDYVPLTASGGEVEALVVIERDITEQRLAEQQLRQADKLRALGTLAGGVAHDFNNLLTAIVGSLELASKRLGNEQALRRYLDNATLAAQRGAALTQRLLGFSRRTEAQPVIVDTAEALIAIRELLARTLGGGVQVEWRVADGLWATCVEADQLEVAVLNLAINARDAMPGGGAVVIEAQNASVGTDDATSELAAGDYVRLTVSDSGEGIPPEVMDRILEPFFTTKPVGKGTGLGLPMVYGFAQRSGGGLVIHSEPGQGTQVAVYLPRAREGLNLTASRHGERPVEAGLRTRILVVDDEPGVRSVTAAALRDLGHTVHETTDAAAGLEFLKARRGDIDLVLVDFAMPGMNGVEFVQQARAAHGPLPVILLTGYFDVEEVPADVLVMHKPFTQLTLEAAVGSVVRAGTELA
jgi:PAS domain S-box-containing protein